MDVFWIILITAYFIPTIIAICNRKQDTLWLFMANLVFGWTVFGWAIICMCATLRDDPFKEQEHW